jgi:hypothetical protein
MFMSEKFTFFQLCGPIKSWKRAQEPTVGSFGFCEFESAEGVLRALRLLNGFSLEGRELKVNFKGYSSCMLFYYFFGASFCCSLPFTSIEVF